MGDTGDGVSRPHEDVLIIRPVDDQTISLEGASRFDNPRIRDAATEGVMLKVEPEVDVRVEIVAVKEA